MNRAGVSDSREPKTYRPVSKAGEAMGESSVTIVKMPSKRRSEKGCVTSAEMRARTLAILRTDCPCASG